MLEQEPEIAEIVTAGEISDEVDYAVAMFLANERGFGLTACQPHLVKTKDGKQLVMMSIDSTFRGDDNNIYGYGEVGKLYLDPENNFEVVYCSPTGEIDEKREELMETAEPQQRPRGKY
ncbi:hypothetical protein GF325_08965 [Candidatus Bathyarchaeota archaeon]|nr:hypothetical protein [Candidatus Bathyarchaeota archaeon]